MVCESDDTHHAEESKPQQVAILALLKGAGQATVRQLFQLVKLGQTRHTHQLQPSSSLQVRMHHARRRIRSQNCPLKRRQNKTLFLLEACLVYSRAVAGA